MKKIYSIIIALTISMGGFSQITNAGFETWNNMGSYNDPDQWSTMNSLTSSFSIYTCTKGTPGNPGTAYLKLVSKNVPGMGVVPGIAATGNLNLMMQTASGYAFSSRPQNFTGSWQYMPATGDTGIVSVLLCKWNTGMNKRDTVAFAAQNLTGMLMSWTNFSIPLTYLNGNNPDTCVIIFSASKKTPVANSFVYVDNLAFTGTVAGIASYKNTASVILYPTPATNKLTIEGGAGTKAEIIDISGKIIKQIDLSSEKESLDVSGYAPGVYFVKTTHGTISSIQKFIKE